MNAPSPSASAKVRLSTAYLLWLFGGLCGWHHAYLGRPQQALVWFGTLGGFGVGWIRDGFLLPYYVSLARSDPNDPVVRIRYATMEARKGVPPLSLLRIAMMAIVSDVFGKINSCLHKGLGAEVIDGIIGLALRSLGIVIGALCVGNIGEETVDLQTIVYLCVCLLVGTIGGFPVLATVVCATRSRKYRPSMVPQGTVTHRFKKHFFACGVLVFVFALAIYNHGYINFNGQKIYAHEAFYNALNSDFFKEFRFEEFRQQSRNERSNYLKQTLDIKGERAACRALGVPVDATFAEIKTAYKSLALQYHPDKIGIDATAREKQKANEQFLKVQEAFEVLTEIEQQKKAPHGKRAKARYPPSRSRGDEF